MSARDFLRSQSHPFNPPDELSDLRRLPISKATMWNGREVWLATRYEDVRRILQDSRFSSNIQNPGFPITSPSQTKTRRRLSRSMGFMDDPGHSEIRRALAGEFVPSRIDGLRPKIERIVMAQIDRVLDIAPPIDLYSAFALQIPLKTIIELLEIPTVDRHLFEKYSASFGSNNLSEIIDEFLTLCERVLEKEDTAPRKGPLARIRNAVHSGRLDQEEACIATMVLFAAGYVTTASAISLGALMLLLNPELFRALRDEPGMAHNITEELLRYHAPHNYGLPRVATEDVYVGERLISKGDGVIVSLASANRDESMFVNPDEFDIKRSEASRHVTFGHGAHKCLGQWIARTELQITLSALATRIPTLRLAVPREEISFIDDSHLFRVKKLPVTW